MGKVGTTGNLKLNNNRKLKKKNKTEKWGRNMNKKIRKHKLLRKIDTRIAGHSMKMDCQPRK